MSSTQVTPRYGYPYGYGGYGYPYRSSWSTWGRWVLTGILIFIGVVFVLTMLLCSVLTRRRRRRGLKPIRGFGWTSRNNNPTPVGNQAMNQQPVYGANNGYGNGEMDAGMNGYGGQQDGYLAPQQGYGAPQGPPPNYGAQQTGVTQPQMAYMAK